jgi:hypothetical protein
LSSFFRLPRRFRLPAADPSPIKLRSPIDGVPHEVLSFSALGKHEEPRSDPRQLEVIENGDNRDRARQLLAEWGFTAREAAFCMAHFVDGYPLRELPAQLRVDPAEIQRIRKCVERKIGRLRYEASQKPDFGTLRIDETKK